MKFVEHEKEVPLIRYITKLVRALHYGEPMPEKPDELSWRDIFTHAYTHSVAGAIWNVVEDAVTAADEDPELIRRWSRERDLEYVKAIQQTRLFATLKEKFIESGVRFLPMKGLILRELWRKPEYRTMSDLDILIHKDGTDRAREIIESLGFSLVHDGDIHDQYNKPPYLTFELHHILEKDSTLTFDDFTESEQTPFMYEMKKEDFLTFVISHIHKHYTHGGCGIRSIFDIRIYLEAYKDEIDMSLLEDKLKKQNLLDFYRIVTRLSEFWYGDGSLVPDDEIFREEYYISGGATYGTVMNRVRYDARTNGKFVYILSRAFPEFAIMAKLYPWLNKCPILLPITWVMRWFAALFDGRLKKEANAIKTAEWKKEDGENN